MHYVCVASLIVMALSLLSAVILMWTTTHTTRQVKWCLTVVGIAGVVTFATSFSFNSVHWHWTDVLLLPLAVSGWWLARGWNDPGLSLIAGALSALFAVLLFWLSSFSWLDWGLGAIALIVLMVTLVWHMEHWHLPKFSWHQEGSPVRPH